MSIEVGAKNIVDSFACGYITKVFCYQFCSRSNI